MTYLEEYAPALVAELLELAEQATAEEDNPCQCNNPNCMICNGDEARDLAEEDSQ